MDKGIQEHRFDFEKEFMEHNRILNDESDYDVFANE